MLEIVTTDFHFCSAYGNSRSFLPSLPLHSARSSLPWQWCYSESPPHLPPPSPPPSQREWEREADRERKRERERERDCVVANSHLFFSLCVAESCHQTPFKNVLIIPHVSAVYCDVRAPPIKGPGWCFCTLQLMFSGFLQFFLWERHYEKAESEPKHLWDWLYQMKVVWLILRVLTLDWI